MILQILISGILLGGMYSVIASGFSIVNGVMKIFNFSHGALIMIGAYITYLATANLGMNPFLTIPLSMIILFILGYFLQKYVINLIVRAPIYMTLILTFGLEMVLVNLALVFWTGDVRTTVVSLSGKSIAFFGANIPIMRLIVLIFAIVVSVGMTLMMTKTRFGRSINATRMDIDAAQLVGVEISKTYALTFGTSAALAGLAGSLLSMIGPITPTMGSLYSIKAFAICILGGSGSMLGPIVGGLIIGILETIGVAVLGGGYQEIVSFAVLVLVLVVRPNGILGKDYY